MPVLVFKDSRIWLFGSEQDAKESLAPGRYVLAPVNVGESRAGDPHGWPGAVIFDKPNADLAPVRAVEKDLAAVKGRIDALETENAGLRDKIKTLEERGDAAASVDVEADK